MDLHVLVYLGPCLIPALYNGSVRYNVEIISPNRKENKTISGLWETFQNRESLRNSIQCFIQDTAFSLSLGASICIFINLFPNSIILPKDSDSKVLKEILVIAQLHKDNVWHKTNKYSESTEK